MEAHRFFDLGDVIIKDFKYCIKDFLKWDKENKDIFKLDYIKFLLKYPLYELTPHLWKKLGGRY